MRRLILLLLVPPLLAARPADRKKVPDPDPQAVAATLLGRALLDDEPYEELRELSDTIGARLSGSPQLDAAIAWGAREMAEDGLTVTREPVMVPVWTRGPIQVEVRHPLRRPISALALGGSVSTPAGGVEAEVLVVSTFEELTARAAEAAGRIVVWDAPFTDYGETVRYRWDGASQASLVGAIASLTRSVTPISLNTPHTGGQGYREGVTPIPTAAITVEDATWLHRLQEAGIRPRIHLDLQASTAPDVPSFNVVGELRGREHPEEIVVLGCHLDSWDVGQGAQDDGAGCVTIMQAGALLAALPVAPRRTVRVVLFTNEENGLAGGRTYARAHAGERIVFALEDDTGSGAPLGFDLDLRDEAGEPRTTPHEAAIAALSPWLPWLAPIGADHLTPGGSGADVGGLCRQGAIGFGLSHDMSGYWPVHHTEADTFDKVDPALVRRNAAAVAVWTWVLAEVAPTVLP